MEIRRFISQQMLTNMYAVEENNRLIIIDPCVENIDLQNLKVDYILLTHEHYDHISALNYWKDKTGATIICSNNCGKNVANPKKNLSHYFKEFVELQTWITDMDVPMIKKNIEDYVGRVDKVFENEFFMPWQNHELYIFETPGHSAGSSCINIDNQYLFSGDTLFKDYPTMCNLPGGSKKKWELYSKKILSNLNKELFVYPGHLDAFEYKYYRFWSID